MPIQPHGPAPYAPPKAIIEIVNIYRDKGLRAPFTLDVLTRAGVTDSLAPRTLQALKLLDLINNEGYPTEEFEKAARAPQEEFRQLLTDLILGAYSDVFSFADPAEQGIERVRDAFRTYTPVGQQERMVTLFLGLLDYLGLNISAAKAGAKDRPPRQPRGRGGRTRTTPQGDGDKLPTRLPDPLRSLLNDALPKEGEPWPKPKRDQFIKTFEALLDLYFPTTARGELEAGAAAPNGSEEEA